MSILLFCLHLWLFIVRNNPAIWSNICLMLQLNNVWSSVKEVQRKYTLWVGQTQSSKMSLNYQESSLIIFWTKRIIIKSQAHVSIAFMLVCTKNSCCSEPWVQEGNLYIFCLAENMVFPTIWLAETGISGPPKSVYYPEICSVPPKVFITLKIHFQLIRAQENLISKMASKIKNFPTYRSFFSWQIFCFYCCFLLIIDWAENIHNLAWIWGH